MGTKTSKSAQLTHPIADNEFAQLWTNRSDPHIDADWVRPGLQVSRTGCRSWGIRRPRQVRPRNRGTSLHHQSSF